MGKGTPRKKIAMNAAPAMVWRTRVSRVRRPIRKTASTTTAITAGFSPKNRPETNVVSP